MTINNKYSIGDILYLKTDEEQKERIVTAITVRPNNQIMYELSQGTVAGDHYEFECTEDKDVLKAMEVS